MEEQYQQQFDRNKLVQILTDLGSTQKSITSASAFIIQLCKDNYQKESVDEWFRFGRDFLNMGEEQKLINLLYLCNDVNLRHKEEILKENFQVAIEKLIKLLIDTPLNKVKNTCLKIFKIQSQRGIFPSDFLDNMQNLIKEGEQDKLPENLPHPPTELIKLITNLQNYQSFKEKYELKENKTEAELKKLQELKGKHCQLSLKSYKEVIQMIDKQHMKSIVEYKLLLQKIEKIENVLKERGENP